MKRTEIIILAIAGIFATGAIIGALYAPDKGERSRRHIARKGRRVFHSASDAWETGKDKIEEMKDDLKDKLRNINETVSELAQK